MSELIHKGGEIIGLLPHRDSIQFPVLTFHFPESELSSNSLTHIVASDNRDFIGNAFSTGLMKSMHRARAVVFAGFGLKEAILLQRTNDGVIAMRKEEQADASSVVTSWSYSKEPLITATFDENNMLHIAITDSDNEASSQPFQLEANPEEGLMVFTGRFSHELENRYEHSGGSSSLNVVDKQRDPIRYGTLSKLIELTDESLRKGEMRSVYYELVSEGGGLILYREIRPESTQIHADSHLTHVKRWLLPGENWKFIPHPHS